MTRKILISKVLGVLKREEDVSNCPRHKKYTGKGEPPKGCGECLKTYINYIKRHPRAPIKPTKLIPDKSKYQRKEKFRKNIDFED